MGLEAHGLHTAFPRERVLEMLVLTSLQRTKSLLKATNTIARTQPLPLQLSYGGGTIDEGASTVLCISSCIYQNSLHFWLQIQLQDYGKQRRNVSGNKYAFN